MAIYYNSVIAYDESSTPYDGTPTAYSYAGNITLTLTPSYSYEDDGGIFYFYYSGKLTIGLDVDSPYVRGFFRRPTVSGLTLRIVPNSAMVIKQYYKTIKDPQVTGGCAQCGTYLYNK